MATSKFNLEAGYMKIISPGSEHSCSAKRVDKIDITWYFSSQTENFYFLACFKQQFPGSNFRLIFVRR